MDDELQITSGTESYLLAIRDDVARVLAIDIIDHTYDRTSLFEMGMDSMTAIELMARLRDHLGLRTTATTLFEASTISDIAKLIVAQAKADKYLQT